MAHSQNDAIRMIKTLHEVIAQTHVHGDHALSLHGARTMMDLLETIPPNLRTEDEASTPLFAAISAQNEAIFQSMIAACLARTFPHPPLQGRSIRLLLDAPNTTPQSVSDRLHALAQASHDGGFASLLCNAQVEAIHRALRQARDKNRPASIFATNHAQHEHILAKEQAAYAFFLHAPHVGMVHAPDWYEALQKASLVLPAAEMQVFVDKCRHELRTDAHARAQAIKAALAHATPDPLMFICAALPDPASALLDAVQPTSPARQEWLRTLCAGLTAAGSAHQKMAIITRINQHSATLPPTVLAPGQGMKTLHAWFKSNHKEAREMRKRHNQLLRGRIRGPRNGHTA